MEKASLKELDQHLNDSKLLTESQIEAIGGKVLPKQKYPVTEFVIDNARAALENEKMMASTTCVVYYHTWCSRQVLNLKALISDPSNQFNKAELTDLKNELQELVDQFSSLKEGFILEGKDIPEISFSADGTFLCPDNFLYRTEDGWPAATDEEVDEIERAILQVPDMDIKDV